MYYAFRDTGTMNDEYVRRLTALGTPAAETCPGEITYTINNVTAGRRLCALVDGKAQVIWSRDAVNTIGVATATDADFTKLVDKWWSNDAYYNT